MWYNYKLFYLLPVLLSRFTKPFFKLSYYICIIFYPDCSGLNHNADRTSDPHSEMERNVHTPSWIIVVLYLTSAFELRWHIVIPWILLKMFELVLQIFAVSCNLQVNSSAGMQEKKHLQIHSSIKQLQPQCCILFDETRSIMPDWNYIPLWPNHKGMALNHSMEPAPNDWISKLQLHLALYMNILRSTVNHIK